MKDLIELVVGLKDLSWKRIILLGFVATFTILIMKAELFIDMYSKHASKSAEVKSVKTSSLSQHGGLLSVDPDLDISQKDIEEIQSYVDKYYEILPPSVISLSVFKFLPEGEEYLYQARVLVYIKSSKIQDVDKFVKETRIKFIPIWSGKFNIEKLLIGEPTLSKFNKESKEFTRLETVQSGIDIIDTIPSSNLSVLVEYGVQTIYRYPIKYQNRVIGYVSVYSSQLSDDELKSLEETLEKFSSRIAVYLKGE